MAFSAVLWVLGLAPLSQCVTTLHVSVHDCYSALVSMSRCNNMVFNDLAFELYIKVESLK